MQVQTFAPTRAGLAGNPSDGYGGRAVSLAIADFQARASIRPAGDIRILSDEGLTTFPDLESLAVDARVDEANRLAVACCRRFFRAASYSDWLAEPPRQGDGFHLDIVSDIPKRVGLAGSSAIAVAVLRALAFRFGAAIPEADLPGLALAVETRDLGIHGGLMDRVSQVFGGLMYMDLSQESRDSEGRASLEPLPPASLPALFIAWKDEFAAGSETIHNPLRDRVASGDPEARAILDDLAALADEARDALQGGFPALLIPIMDRNFDLRARLVNVGEGNHRLVETGRRLGAGVKQAGSGGAVVGAHDGDPERLGRLRAAYERIGARFCVPSVWSGPTVSATRAGEARRTGRQTTA